MSGPNLSEYFQNDGPSMFDEIISNTATTMSRTSNLSVPKIGKLNFNMNNLFILSILYTFIILVFRSFSFFMFLIFVNLVNFLATNNHIFIHLNHQNVVHI